jgi:2-dehydro-3-deoxygalactonokinase
MFLEFTSCDWGTTNLRVRRVVDGCVVREFGSASGVAQVEGNFATVLQEAMETIGAKPPVVISGMAGSSIGWCELPYAELPFPLDGRGAVIREIEKGIFLVSGVCGNKEIMRGEETELLGLENLPAETLAILPGTHSKHCQIRGAELVAFKTYLTGEVRQAIRSHTVLSRSIAGGWDEGAFREGVTAGASGTLLGELFRVRTRQVLDGCPAAANGAYLDGLLIGAELSGLASAPSVLVAAGPAQHVAYQTAIDTLDLGSRTRFLAPEEVALLAVRGQARLLDKLLK